MRNRKSAGGSAVGIPNYLVRDIGHALACGVRITVLLRAVDCVARFPLVVTTHEMRCGVRGGPTLAHEVREVLTPTSFPMLGIGSGKHRSEDAWSLRHPFSSAC
jgi:hypothetical protein